MMRNATPEDLTKIAICHREAFPHSVTSLLGIPFIRRMLEWYLSAPNKFLFWVEENNQCIGYCGGYIMDGSDAYGSASGMTQSGFNAAFKIMLRKPWLFFHPEIRARYPFILTNIKHKIKRFAGVPQKTKLEKTVTRPTTELTAGLVVIGVSPSMHKKGIGTLLQQEFERRAKVMHATKMELSVRKENKQAIDSYTRNGWIISSDQQISYQMKKTIR
jgi:ribosomal protein S18 acetylase RimI-like enzyme